MSSLDEFAQAQREGTTVGHEWNRQQLDKLVASGFGSDPHKAELIKNETTGEYWTLCQCGAHWSHGSHQTASEIVEIHRSHVAYFNRLPATVL